MWPLLRLSLLRPLESPHHHMRIWGGVLILAFSAAAVASDQRESGGTCPTCPPGTVRVEWWVDGVKRATMGLPPQGGKLGHKSWRQDAVLFGERDSKGAIHLTLAGSASSSPRKELIVGVSGSVTVPRSDPVVRAIVGQDGAEFTLKVVQ